MVTKTEPKIEPKIIPAPDPDRKPYWDPRRLCPVQKVRHLDPEDPA